MLFFSKQNKAKQDDRVNSHHRTVTAPHI